MSDREITIHVKISRRTFIWAAAAVLMCCAANEVVSEQMTVTTYYPAPAGVYKKLTTTRDTYLARDGGGVSIGSSNAAPAGSLIVNGSIGVGTSTPAFALDVNGGVSVAQGLKLGADTNACTALKEGTLMWNTTNSPASLQVCTRSAWTPVVPPSSQNPSSVSPTMYIDGNNSSLIFVPGPGQSIKGVNCGTQFPATNPPVYTASNVSGTLVKRYWGVVVSPKYPTSCTVTTTDNNTYTW